ncbi:hypothetical protein BDZ94DRAFT_1316892 [Collybia nuda]|uniref:Uncharacterized protein n=1 Tax=Collybia nuda TaxID=64659 RepID=A0A9P6CQ13_9AGAR|nr:hypothetical protein BDZ94DRAFT_1316892 [Collybia nuda]
MAKPMYTGRAGCSSSSSSCSQQHSTLLKHRKRRPQRSSSSSSSSLGPSSSLLSLLAAIAASTTTANGSPAPLPFLCPSFAQSPTVENFEPRGPPAPQFASDGPNIPDYRAVPRHVPDRYVQDDDGRWRLVEEYTFYGSTICPSCREPTNAVTSVDDQIQGPAPPLSDSSPSPSPSDDIRLPPGWKPPTGINKGHTTLIIVLSLVLAFVICFFIIGCLFWRKSQRRKLKLKQNDVEARRRHRPPAEDDREFMLEKEIRAKQKIWARATARWKANIRYSARQRRGKRIVSTTRMTQHSTTSVDQSPDGSTTPTSFVPSPTSSRRSSMESMYVTSSAIEATTDPPLSPEQVETPPSPTPSPVSPPRALASSPPAYQQPPRIPSEQLHNLGTGRSVATPTSLQYHFCSRCHSSHSFDTTCGSDLCPPTLHAHVATDDKNLLARLTQLASSPPSEGVLSSEGEPSIPEVSAPAWEDEELDDFRQPGSSLVRRHSSSLNDPARTSSPTLPFPPPPSKGKMSGPNFYDYPYTFDDITMDPEIGPAAPPFEAGPSAPPTNSIDLMPSAPPLMDEDTYYSEVHGRTPLFGWGPATSPLPLENVDQTRTGIHDQVVMPTNHIRQSATSLPSPTTDTLLPPVQGPVASDGTPPSYHP